MAEEAAKPVTDDPDEQELLADAGIPLTDPAAKAPVAPAETEDPAKEPETPAAVTPEAEPEKEEPAPEAKKDTEPVKPAAESKPPQKHPLITELEDLEAKIQADDFDGYSKEGRTLQLKHTRVAAKVAALEVAGEQQAVADTFETAAEENGITVSRAKSEWKTALKDAEAKYGKGSAALAVATERWEDKLAAIKNGTKGAKAAKEPEPKGKPVAKTPITPAGAKVAPPAQAAVPPAPRPKTDEEELVEYQQKNVPGGIKSLSR